MHRPGIVSRSSNETPIPFSDISRGGHALVTCRSNLYPSAAVPSAIPGCCKIVQKFQRSCFGAPEGRKFGRSFVTRHGRCFPLLFCLTSAGYRPSCVLSADWQIVISRSPPSFRTVISCGDHAFVTRSSSLYPSSAVPSAIPGCCKACSRSQRSCFGAQKEEITRISFVTRPARHLLFAVGCYLPPVF